MAKRYHPDSSATPDEEKFKQAETAYRTVINHRKATSTNSNADAVDELLEEELASLYHHKAPAHRQYLANEGVGYGTVFQRQRQYHNFKLNRATETAFNYRMEKSMRYTEDALVTLDRQATKRNKTRNAIERVVEDMIQASMERGEFENLPGAGKPLKATDFNPYVDNMTLQMNKILINNGGSNGQQIYPNIRTHEKYKQHDNSQIK